MTRTVGALVLAALLAIVAGPAAAQVGADLNISPKRLTLDEGERSATVYVFNQGDAPATSTIEMVDRVMLPDGRIVAAADAPGVTVNSAADIVQYTPRRVTLQAKESQSIRVRVRPPAADGEYRTHLTVTALPPEDTGFTADQAVQSGGGDVALKVVALFSVSIPVIVRQGPVDARAGLENLAVLAPGEGHPNGVVSLDLVRLGSSSVYGDIEIHAVAGSRDRLVGAVRGLAVYAELPRRSLAVPLSEPLRPGETLRVVYRDQDLHPGAILAAASPPAP